MNPRFDVATGKVMSGHYFSSKAINQKSTPLVPKEKAHPSILHVHHVHHTKHHKKHKYILFCSSRSSYQE